MARTRKFSWHAHHLIRHLHLLATREMMWPKVELSRPPLLLLGEYRDGNTSYRRRAKEGKRPPGSSHCSFGWRRSKRQWHSRSTCSAHRRSQAYRQPFDCSRKKAPFRDDEEAVGGAPQKGVLVALHSVRTSCDNSFRPRFYASQPTYFLP